jgi:hypothetical protein
MVMAGERRNHSKKLLSKQSSAVPPDEATGVLPRRRLNMVASQAIPIGWPSALGEHITVALIPPVADQLRCLQKNTDLSITDLTNRAITWYAFLDEHLRAGNDLIVRDNWTGEERLVRIA